MNLPTDIDPDDFDRRFRLDTASWIGAVHDICSVHKIPASALATYPDGSNLLARVGEDRIVKIFPPFHSDQWDSEHIALTHLTGLCPIEIPQLIASGVRQDGWHYVVLSLVAGETLEKHWSAMSHHDRIRAMTDVGITMARIQTIPISGPLNHFQAWDAFLAAQADKCWARHKRSGEPEWLIDQVDGWIRDQMPLLQTTQPALLTGEYTPFNLLATDLTGSWRLSGMIDFGDAMIGHPEYDLLGPSAFLASGDRDLIQSLFTGYGLTDPDLSLHRRLMALLLLHKYSNLSRQIRIPNWQTKVNSIEALMHLIWPE
jgi:hygromycin-B 7''-O-kinase